MTKPHHPLRDLDVHVWHSTEAPVERAFIAMFSDYRNTPVYFAAPTYAEARDRAVRWRDRAVEANEAAYIARAENLAKARARKKAKGG